MTSRRRRGGTSLKFLTGIARTWAREPRSRSLKQIQGRLLSLAEGHVSGAELSSASRYRRAVAKKHVVIFSLDDDTIRIVRVVHGSQDLEAIARDLEEGETP